MAGLFVSCWLTPAQASQLALDGGEPASQLHVTLAHLPEDLPPYARQTVERIAADVAAAFAPLTGSVPGLGVWTGEGDGDVLYGSVDVPGLEWVRAALVAELKAAGFEISCNHGFSPHVTLAYLQPGTPADVGGWVPLPVTLDSVAVTAPDDDPAGRVDVPFGNVSKDDPGPSDVHVDVPLGSKPASKRKRKKGDPAVTVAETPESGVKIVKADQARRLVYGVVLEPHAEDSQGDWETADDIEKAAHGFLGRRAPLGLQHRALAPESVRPVESFIAPADFAYPENPADVIRKGSWVVVAHVDDDRVWKATQEGLFGGWSIGGTGRRVNEQLPG